VNDISQQVNLARVFIIQGGICLLRRLVVIVIIFFAIQDVILKIVILIVIIIMVHVDITVARTSTRQAQSTRGSSHRHTAGQ
jgi:hypothetical protein